MKRQDAERGKKEPVLHWRDYRLVRKLGSGSFANVYEGIHRRTGKHVALKVIKEEASADDNIEQERVSLEVVARLHRHPNIINFLGELEHPRKFVPVFVFELAQGGSLFHRLRKLDTFSEADTRDVVKGVLNGLRFLHSVRTVSKTLKEILHDLDRYTIIHRDIKPENILLHSRGFPLRPAISDLGIAECVGPGSTVPFNAGTLTYTPPEAFKLGLLGRKGDIWPVGVVMHEMLIGFHPFYSSDLEKYLEYLKQKLDLKGEKYQKVSADGLDLMEKLLKKNPNDRISADEALRHPWIRTAPKQREFTAVNLTQYSDEDAFAFGRALQNVKNRLLDRLKGRNRGPGRERVREKKPLRNAEQRHKERKEELERRRERRKGRHVGTTMGRAAPERKRDGRSRRRA